jgi:hypothetical protein
MLLHIIVHSEICLFENKILCSALLFFFGIHVFAPLVYMFSLVGRISHVSCVNTSRQAWESDPWSLEFYQRGKYLQYTLKCWYFSELIFLTRCLNCWLFCDVMRAIYQQLLFSPYTSEISDYEHLTNECFHQTFAPMSLDALSNTV